MEEKEKTIEKIQTVDDLAPLPQLGTKHFVRRMTEYIEEKSNPSSPKSPNISIPFSPFNQSVVQLVTKSPSSPVQSQTTTITTTTTLSSVEQEAPQEITGEVLMDHAYEENKVVDLLEGVKSMVQVENLTEKTPL